MSVCRTVFEMFSVKEWRQRMAWP